MMVIRDPNPWGRGRPDPDLSKHVFTAAEKLWLVREVIDQGRKAVEVAKAYKMNRKTISSRVW